MLAELLRAASCQAACGSPRLCSKCHAQEGRENPTGEGTRGQGQRTQPSCVDIPFYLENIFVFLCAFHFPLYFYKLCCDAERQRLEATTLAFMWASAERVLGAVHGQAGVSPAATSVSGNLGASIKPSDRAEVALGDRKQSAGLYGTKGTAQIGGARPRGAAGSPGMAVTGGSLAARG